MMSRRKIRIPRNWTIQFAIIMAVAIYIVQVVGRWIGSIVEWLFSIFGVGVPQGFSGDVISIIFMVMLGLGALWVLNHFKLALQILDGWRKKLNPNY